MRVESRNRRSELAGQTLALVMAGGNGSRLGSLTRWDSKPALSFGGQYRNVDFALSNSVNSGIRRIALLTQYKAHSLIQHVQQGWSFLRPELGELMEVWPAQQRRGKDWYAGTADAIYQNVDLIERLAPERVLVLAADHVYRMDYRPMLEAHVATGLGATVGCIEVPLAAASEFGVMATDSSGRVRHFAEKPARPLALPARPDVALASMGIYVLDRDLLLDALAVDAEDPGSTHDFGRDVLPLIIRAHGVAAYAFRDRVSGAPGYWRDVGTLDSYWQAHMDLLGDPPPLDLNDSSWPIHTRQAPRPPARFAGGGVAARSIVAGGCEVAGIVEETVLATDCEVGRGARVTRSVVLPGARIGAGCRVDRAVVEAGCVLPDGLAIGEDRELDSARYEVTAQGVALVTAQAIAKIVPARETLEVA